LPKDAERKFALVLRAAAGHDGHCLTTVSHCIIEGRKLFGSITHRLGNPLDALLQVWPNVVDD
jgi:hypothetical protein